MKIFTRHVDWVLIGLASELFVFGLFMTVFAQRKSTAAIITHKTPMSTHSDWYLLGYNADKTSVVWIRYFTYGTSKIAKIVESNVGDPDAQVMGVVEVIDCKDKALGIEQYNFKSGLGWNRRTYLVAEFLPTSYLVVGYNHFCKGTK